MTRPRWIHPAVVLCVVLALQASPAAHGEYEPHAEGHIAAGGRWTDVRSTSVLLDRDSVDGFFFASPGEGRWVKAVVVRNGGCDVQRCGYVLALNFHGPGSVPPRPYRGGCTGEANAPVECLVPTGATTGEVTASAGIDLDVEVLLKH